MAQRIIRYGFDYSRTIRREKQEPGTGSICYQVQDKVEIRYQIQDKGLTASSRIKHEGSKTRRYYFPKDPKNLLLFLGGVPERSEGGGGC